MRAALAIFGLALAACPREMREEYGAAMRSDFVAALQQRGIGAALAAYADVIAGGLAERAATIGRDAVFAVRGMRRAPFFAAVVIITMALAIGANGAVYGLIANIVLRPLPVADPGSLYALWEVDRLHGTTTEGFTYDDFVAVRRGNHTLRSVAALANSNATLVGPGGPPQVLRGTTVSGDFFGTYGARPQMGRLLDLSDERDGVTTVVLSDELWRARFSADPRIVGRSVQIGDVSRTVIGIAPPKFFYANLYRGMIDHADYFIPLHRALFARAGHQLFVVGRPSGSVDAVDGDLARIFASLAAANPEADAHLSARAVSVTEAIFGPMRPSMIAVALAVLAVLAVACANIANLFLSRASARSGEIATRFALGSTRRRLIAQLMTETSIYVALGGLVGIILAAAFVHVMAGLIDAGAPVMYLRHLEVDWKTFAATILAMVIATILSGVIPALALSRPALASAMKSGDRGSSGAGRTGRGALVTLEVALAIAVVAVAAITARSYYDTVRQPLGFEPTNVTVVSLGGASHRRYNSGARVASLLRSIRERVDASPGIEAAAWSQTTPFIGETQAAFTVSGARYAPGSEPMADVNLVSPGFFGVLGVPLLAGRDVAASDGANAPGVVVVSRSFALRQFGGVPAALGKRLTIEWSMLDVPVRERTVVGVVGDIRPHLGAEPQPTMYAPIAQIPALDWIKLSVRSRQPADDVVSAVRAAVAASDPTIPPPSATSLEHERFYEGFQRQTTVDVLVAMAVIALGLAIAGIYAVVAYNVARRTREIGVRVAFGATPREIAGMILRNALRLASVGIALGLVLGAVAGWALKQFLDVDAPIDATTVLTVLAVVALAIAAASYVPARRAARLDPVVALRYE